MLNTVTGKPKASKLWLNETEFLNFSSNDYLGLSADPLLLERAKEFLGSYGAGSASSRLIAGTLKIHTRLEEKLAALYQRERVLLYSTGFQANSTILPAITGKEDLILADKQCHNSIITGCLASKAKWNRFRHNDMNHLESILIKAQSAGFQNIWVITESVFSMDGDMAPLYDIVALSKKYGARVYVDDAHGIGVFGKTGLGCTEGMNEIDIIIGTFGKAAGSFGAFAACSNTVAEALVNFSNGFIYTTALPPPVIGAIDAAYDRIPQMNKEREHLLGLSLSIKEALNKSGFETGNSASHIVPVLTGGDKQTVALSERLHQQNIFAPAIRPPTVPEGKGRIRLSVTAHHTQNDIKSLTEALQNE